MHESRKESNIHTSNLRVIYSINKCSYGYLDLVPIELMRLLAMYEDGNIKDKFNSPLLCSYFAALLINITEDLTLARDVGA